MPGEGSAGEQNPTCAAARGCGVAPTPAARSCGAGPARNRKKAQAETSLMDG